MVTIWFIKKYCQDGLLLAQNGFNNNLWKCSFLKIKSLALSKHIIKNIHAQQLGM